MPSARSVVDWELIPLPAQDFQEYEARTQALQNAYDGLSQRILNFQERLASLGCPFTKAATPASAPAAAAVQQVCPHFSPRNTRQVNDGFQVNVVAAELDADAVGTAVTSGLAPMFGAHVLVSALSGDHCDDVNKLSIARGRAGCAASSANC